MASKVLDNRTLKRLQPATSLWKQYDPAAAPRAFKAEDPAQARRWQRTTRRALAKHLGIEAGDETDLAPRKVEEIDKGDYTRQKIILRTGPHDPIFPVTAVRSSLTKTRRVYGVFSARQRVEADIFSGRHQISGARAYDFLREALV